MSNDVSWFDGIEKILPAYFWVKNSEEKIEWLRENLSLTLRDAFTVLKFVSSGGE